MATTTTKPKGAEQKSADGVQQLIEGLQQNERSALEAVKRFVDTVNDSFPSVGQDGPRQKIIDTAFRMTQQIVDASNQLAINLVGVTENTLEGLAKPSDTPR